MLMIQGLTKKNLKRQQQRKPQKPTTKQNTDSERKKTNKLKEKQTIQQVISIMLAELKQGKTTQKKQQITSMLNMHS